MQQIEKQQMIVRRDLNKLYEIEEQLKIFEVEDLRIKYLNKYYKYPNNSYSCPESKEDYWDIYYYIYNVTEDGMLDTIKHEKNSDNEIRVSKEQHIGQHFDNQHVEISKEEYLDAWKLIQVDIHKFEQMFQSL